MRLKIQNSEFKMVLLAALALAGCPGGGGGGQGRSALDSDGDGFTDAEERNAIPGSDPFNPNDTPLNPIDTDGDGCSDFDEINFEDFCDNDPNTGGGGGQPGGLSNTFSLRVARHVDRPISAAEVDSIFRTASSLLQLVHRPCPDVATNVTFRRNGGVETFSTGDSVVTTERELDALFALPQDFKVVEGMVGVCGAPPSELTTLLGCAIDGGSVVIIADAPPDVWAHEWGHVQGLPHRDNCNTNLMHSTELETNAVNQRERDAFLSPGPRGKLAVGGEQRTGNREQGLSNPLLARAADEPIKAWLERVVSRRYRAGIPVGLTEQITASDSSVAQPTARAVDSPTAALRRMLEDPGFEQHRANVARLLGLAGDVEAVPGLISTAVSGVGPVNRSGFNARVEAFLALGRLVTADPTGAALEFLAQGSEPQLWAGLGVNWSFGSYAGERLHGLLARFSIMALGLSGSGDALLHLYELRERIDAGLLDAALIDQVDEAIARCEAKWGQEP